MTPEFAAILILAGIVTSLLVAILGFLRSLAGRVGKVEGLLEAMAGRTPERAPE